MATNQFYELYRRLAEYRNEPEKCHSAIGELAQLCHEQTRASSLEECLAVADSCLREICQSQTLFAVAVSSWLTHEEDIELAKALVHEASVDHFQATAALAYDLFPIDESLAFLAASRLCALHSSPAISLGWTLSLVISYPENAKALKVAQQLLQHHMNEYPSTTQRLLASQNSPFNSVGLASQALALLEQQQITLTELPRIREFAMSPEMRLTFASLKRSESRDIQRHSEESSIFSQFVTKQHFKYANKTAVEFVVGDEVQETSLAMTSFQLSVELPTSELTDPVSGAMSRTSLWKGLPE
ncbi:MAG: hypothetical protein K2X80_19300 [Pseudomonadaceae bacterium]|nr:hypothetical protein [Pseudomonadaceae bacterium]